MQVVLNLNRLEDYRMFLRIKSLPKYSFTGRVADFPDEYAEVIGAGAPLLPPVKYRPIDGLFDYQRDISALAIRKQKYAVFADCGLGKTMILLEFARHCLNVLPPDQAVLIVSPLMVVSQTVAEAKRFYGDDLKPTIIPAKQLAHWTQDRYSPRLGITNYDALAEAVECGKVGALILDESSMLKSMYGKWGQHCLRIGAGLKWKLCLTGTPAPNDRIEYANHAVFLDAFPTPNSFLARFFINRGQTSERWEMKAHAVSAFYRALSHWCIFLTNPATYGWSDNCGAVPPIHVHIHDVAMTDAQTSSARELTGTLYVDTPGGITGRAKLARIAKGKDSLKPAFIRGLVDSWPEESTLIWCRFNEEQDRLAAEIPGCASIDGATPHEKRQAIIDDFKAGKIKTLITKPKILGFGLNLHVATRQIFSSLHDSYEEYYQAVKRSNRIGSTRPLNVHIPVTEAERPMVENVLRKAKRVIQDTEEQECLFKTNQEYPHAH